MDGAGTIDTLGPERVMLSFHGHSTVSIRVSDPDFGAVATLRLSEEQAATLAAGLATMLLDGSPAQLERRHELS